MGNKIESEVIKWCNTIKYLMFSAAEETNSLMKSLSSFPGNLASFEKQSCCIKIILKVWRQRELYGTSRKRIIRGKLKTLVQEIAYYEKVLTALSVLAIVLVQIPLADTGYKTSASHYVKSPCSSILWLQYSLLAVSCCQSLASVALPFPPVLSSEMPALVDLGLDSPNHCSA